MKKRICLALLLLACAVLATACAAKDETTPLATSTSSVPTVLNSSEYTLYQNIFYNNYASQYVGKSMTKRGVITSIYDAYSSVTRYYVCGYLDQTKCCDWQWELQVEDPSTLPAFGSLVEVTGIFAQDEGALDQYWLSNAKVNTLTTYTGATADINMLTMTGTLERVQVMNYSSNHEAFEGKTVFAYGRVFGPNMFQDPYYDGSWTAAFVTNDEVPAVGTSIILRGVMQAGIITDAKLETI